MTLNTELFICRAFAGSADCSVPVEGQSDEVYDFRFDPEDQGVSAVLTCQPLNNFVGMIGFLTCATIAKYYRSNRVVPSDPDASYTMDVLLVYNYVCGLRYLGFCVVLPLLRSTTPANRSLVVILESDIRPDLWIMLGLIQLGLSSGYHAFHC